MASSQSDVANACGRPRCDSDGDSDARAVSVAGEWYLGHVLLVCSFSLLPQCLHGSTGDGHFLVVWYSL